MARRTSLEDAGCAKAERLRLLVEAEVLTRVPYRDPADAGAPGNRGRRE
ncbi:hypothetical protein QF030_002431 [Streptomyces rishiriensis]|uniref:Uncharacterized protein n=1 Tax=Streptomyces rishiriensis TaxID=68264 RepID=A0ABU0NND9_STRRH|nr:hypothetical protein [Streptomyces rishiriensis]